MNLTAAFIDNKWTYKQKYYCANCKSFSVISGEYGVKCSGCKAKISQHLFDVILTKQQQIDSIAGKKIFIENLE